MKKDLLDKQWIALILEAKAVGLTVEDIRDFLTLHSRNIQTD